MLQLKDNAHKNISEDIHEGCFTEFNKEVSESE